MGDTRLTEAAARVRDGVVAPDHRKVVTPDAPRPSAPDGASQDAAGRFDLFHFTLSVCSQKVRATLYEKGAGWRSNELVIFPPVNENYHPDYVRLRLMSEAAGASEAARGYSGATSVEDEGFDALVVPTLVDHEAGRVLTDSKRVCLYLDGALDGPKLVPETLRDAVLRQLSEVDRTPHAALLYGADPEGDHRPDPVRGDMKGIHARKIEAVERNMALADGDARVLSAYEAKIEKERAAARFVGDRDRMRGAIETTRDLLARLEDVLRRGGGPWVLGEAFTLADVFWGVSLFRLQWLGYAGLWEGRSGDLPRVRLYADRLYRRPSIKNGVIEWPGHPPSPSVENLIPGEVRSPG